MYRKNPRFCISVVTQSFMFNYWQNLQAISKGGAILAFWKTASPCPFSGSVLGNLKRSVKCPQPQSPRVRTHSPFLPDYSSLLVQVNAMLLCCVVVCGGWVLSTTPPWGCGNQAESPPFACVYMTPRQLASGTSPTQPIWTFFTKLSSCTGVM